MEQPKYPTWLVPLLIGVCLGLLSLLTTLYVTDRSRVNDRIDQIQSTLAAQAATLARIEGWFQGGFGAGPELTEPGSPAEPRESSEPSEGD